MSWAVLYPGQGSQAEGMGRVLLESFPKTRLVFEEASDAVSIDLKALCIEGSAQDLALTQNTQPALLTVSVATFRVLKDEWGFAPAVAAGHSVGEYAALVNADVMDFSQAVRAVRFRGEVMQSAVPVGVGAMAAMIGWEDQAVVDFCRWASRESGMGTLEPANFNSPGQVVVSGHKSCLEWAEAHYHAGVIENAPSRLKLIPLKVSAPFHCSLMRPAEDQMRALLSTLEFQAPRHPVIQNLTAEAVTTADQLRENLIRQVSSPVRWAETLRLLPKLGVTKMVECGSGKVLQGLCKKTLGEANPCLVTQSLDDLRTVEAALMGQGGSRW